MLFTELNTKVLLNVYACLDLTDSINLAGTCIRLRDVAQLHHQQRYKVFNLHNFLNDAGQAKRHNGIDASIVLKRIGSFITALVSDLHEGIIGCDVGKAIRKYCVNVKSLKIVDRFEDVDECTYARYTEWLNSLKLEAISLSMQDLVAIDLSETTTLKGLDIYYWTSLQCDGMTSALHKILASNCNISSLRTPLMNNYDYGTFAKLKFLKCLGLRICTKDLKKVAKIMDVKKLEIRLCSGGIEAVDSVAVDEFNILFQNLGENALCLEDLSIEIDSSWMVEYPLPSLRLFNLESLNLNVIHANLYKNLPKMQPQLKHLDLVIYNDEADKMDNTDGLLASTHKIIYLITILENLEVFHTQIDSDLEESEGLERLEELEELRSEMVIRRIFDACSTSRPSLRLYVKHPVRISWKEIDFFQIKLDFSEHKYTVTDIPFRRNYVSDSVEHQSMLPCCY